MGRLQHLQRTLPLNTCVRGATCVVVDYSCPDGTGAWVEANFPEVEVVRVAGKQFFNVSEARNRGAAKAQTPWLFFLDADCSVAPDFISRIGPLRAGCSYHATTKPGMRHGKAGSFLCERETFIKAGGFDPVFQGWGVEDRDMVRRLALHGATRVEFPHDALVNHPHSDAERTQHYPIRDMQYSQVVNRIYMDIKAGLGDVDLTMSVKRRQHLHSVVQSTVRDSLRLQRPADLRIPVARSRIMNFELTSVAHFHLELEHNNWTPAAAEDSGRRLFTPALAAIEQRFGVPDDSEHEQPVCLFAAGVRSGSTLLQRMIMRECFMWGEPWGRSGLIRHLVAPAASVTPNWPPDEQLVNHERFQDDLSGIWTANMAPTPENLLTAARAYLNQLFIPGAQERGFTRWGFKEVRCDADDALFLRTLYPHAKILFLIRNPYDAYCSYRRLNQRWLFNLPDDYLDSPRRFGEHWHQLARGFLERHESLGAHLFYYERFLSDSAEPGRLEEHLGLRLDHAARDIVVRGGGPAARESLPETIGQELEQLSAVVQPLAEELGYTGPSDS